MVKKDPDVIAMIAYKDGVAALEWLARAFGFRERRRMIGGDGRLAHGEMETGNGWIMLATPTPDYEGPSSIAATANKRVNGRRYRGSSTGRSYMSTMFTSIASKRRAQTRRSFPNPKRDRQRGGIERKIWRGTVGCLCSALIANFRTVTVAGSAYRFLLRRQKS
jgi:hypothetical protein